MAKPPRDRFILESRTWFMTAKTWQGTALFQVAASAQLFLEILYSYCEQGKLELHEFVVMPNHIHLILTPAPAVTLAQAVQFVKGGFSHRYGLQFSSHREIWQRGYVDHRIRDRADYVRHRDYIHLNPVQARLVASPEAYCYSLAHPGFVLDPAPPAAEAPVSCTPYGTTEVVPSRKRPVFIVLWRNLTPLPKTALHRP